MVLPDDPDMLARLLYLVVLLVGLIALSFNGGPLRIGRWLRDLAIWGLVAAMIVIVYANRDTLEASLFPGRAVVGADGTIELRRGLDGHFSADLVVNGAPIRFLVDTGATDIVLGRSDARKAGLDPPASPSPDGLSPPTARSQPPRCASTGWNSGRSYSATSPPALPTVASTARSSECAS